MIAITLMMMVVTLIIPLPLADPPPMIGLNVAAFSSAVELVGVVRVDVANVVGTLVFILVRLDNSVLCRCDDGNALVGTDKEMNDAEEMVSSGVVSVGLTDIKGCAGICLVVGSGGELEDGGTIGWVVVGAGAG